MALDSRRPGRHLTVHSSGPCAVFWALLLFCTVQPTLLSSVTGVNLTLTEQTLCLLKDEKATAKFTCTFTDMNITVYIVNWYATYNGSGVKRIADSATKVLGKFRTSLDVVMGTAELNITTLNMNDSGEYYCKLVPFPFRRLPVESNKVWLNITGDPKTPCLGRQVNNLSSQTVITSVIMLVVSLGALATLCGLIVFMLLKRKQGNVNPGNGTLPVPMEAQDAPVYSLEYAVLEFQNPKKTQRVSKVHEDANVEYAAIIVPPRVSAASGWR